MREAPCATVTPSSVQSAGATTLHEPYAKVPVRLPSWQVRISDWQVEPKGTLASRYAVTELPCVTVCPLKVQERLTVSVREHEPPPPGPETVPLYVVLSDGKTVVEPGAVT